MGLSRQVRFGCALIVLSALWMAPLRGFGQDLVAVSSLTSGSVFVFRAIAKGVKRIAQAVKPSRSKAQRAESVARVKRQYETIAKANPNKQRAVAVEPGKLPTAKALPADQAAKVFAGVGEYYIAQRDLDNAADVFKEALTLDANNTSAKLGLSEALAMKGNDRLEKDQYTEAKALFQEAITFDPKNSAAYFGLAELYNEQNQTAEAIANYERSLENDSKLTEIYVPLGILYFQSGQIAKADDLLSKAIAERPDSAETQFFLGLVRASQNRHDEALAGFHKAAAIDANYAEAYSHAGESLLSLKRPEEAITDFQKAVKLKPDLFDAWVGLGSAYFDVDNFTESVNAYNQAKKLKNDDWEVYAGLGDALLKAGSFNDAAANYNLAITFLGRAKEPNKVTLADLYSKVGFALGQQCPLNQAKFVPCQWGSAIKALEKAVEISGKPLDYTNLGWAYFNASRADRDDKRTADQQAKLALAKAALQRAIDANPPYLYSVLQNLGAVQLDMGDFKGAIDSLTKVVEKQPDWAFSKYALGSAYFMIADYNNAAAQFRSAIEIDPNYVAAMSSLGSIFVKQKNGKEAKKVLEQLRTRDPRAAQQLEQQMRVAGIK